MREKQYLCTTKFNTTFVMKKTHHLFFCTMVLILSASYVSAEQSAVAKWYFSTGYSVKKNGVTAVYTPDSTVWSAISNRYWSNEQPFFRPNEYTISGEDCHVTLKTSHKWETKLSDIAYILRMNTKDNAAFTNPADYADGSKHAEYFEMAFPTLGLNNVKLAFAISDGQSASATFGVVCSSDGGATWSRLGDYTCGNHWKKFNDAEYALNADNKAQVIVRVLVQSNATNATHTNYNLKYVTVLADDHEAPQLLYTDPVDNASRVTPTGKIALWFNEKIQLTAGSAGILTNTLTSQSLSVEPLIKDNKLSFAYDSLDLTTPYIFTIAGGVISDLSGNSYTQPIVLHFTTSDVRPIPSPVLESTNRLWYHAPATAWEEELPLGNGRLGAMVAGAVAKDTVQLNEDTFWDCSPNSNHNPNARSVLGNVQSLILSGKYEAGQRLALANWNSTTSNGASYKAAGCLLLGFPGHRYDDEESGQVPAGTALTARDAQAYVRSLDMNNATAVTSYIIDSVTYTRTVFCSFADNVTVIRLEASQPGRLNFNLCYAAPVKTNITSLGQNTLTEEGMIHASLVPARTTTEGVSNLLNCHTYIKVINEGGTQKTATEEVQIGNLVASQSAAPSIVVSNADAATVVISSATNFVSYNDVSGDADARALNYMNTYLAKNKSYAATLADHTAAYQQYFNRVSLDLGHNDLQEQKTTKDRIREFSTISSDPGLVSNYFQFGRYLLISSSQPGTQPANLQGIWNPEARQYPAWDSKYTTNINVEMNYWPAEVTNLTECHEPFVEMVKDVSRTGAVTAQQMYGARGWTLHHNTDIWRTTGAVDNGAVGVWPTCNAWFCSHLWEKYLFTGDKAYLTEVYPVMKGAAQFYQDFLVEDPKTHYMVVCPSNSPENNPGIGSYTDDNGKTMKIALFSGVAMDNQMVYDLLRNTALAARALGVDPLFADSLDALKARLTPYKIGRYGQVQEWQEDWDRENSSHRHLSHLWGAYPGNQVSPYINDTVYQAVRKSLIGRGDGARGWSMGWKVCQWARMLDGDHALNIIKTQLRLMSPDATMNDPDGGTYANMFDAHAPFQIDGNFGCCAGIAEMLVQSHAGFVHLLPALPQAWADGEVHGLRTRGGFEIEEMIWQNGEITSLRIRSTIGGNLRLRLPNVLEVAGATQLTEAAGPNTNPLMQPYEMPAPIVADESKIPATVLPETYLYDIPTTPGQVLTLTAVNGTPSSIGNTQADCDTVVKKIADGRVLICRGGICYDVLGNKLQ